MTSKIVKIKSYKELKNEAWFVDDMKCYCGRETPVICEANEDFVYLDGCGEWQFEKSGLIEV